MHIRIDATVLILIGILFLSQYLWQRHKEKRQLQQTATVTIDDGKRYIVWVTTEDKDGGYTSRWHGWSRNLLLTHDEAIAEKAKLEGSFFAVDILEVQRIPKGGETDE